MAGESNERALGPRASRRLRNGVLAGLLVRVSGCDEGDLFGPDLGPTVGPEHDGVLLELSFPERVLEGESVPFRVLLMNVGSEPYTINDPQFDVYLLDGSGSVLWNFLYGNVIIGGIPHTISPGETYEFEVVWELNRNANGTVAAGDYLVFSVYYPLSPPALVSEIESITIAGQ